MEELGAQCRATGQGQLEQVGSRPGQLRIGQSEAAGSLQ
jgi:hypothetical protein